MIAALHDISVGLTADAAGSVASWGLVFVAGAAGSNAN